MCFSLLICVYNNFQKVSFFFSLNAKFIDLNDPIVDGLKARFNFIYLFLIQAQVVHGLMKV